MLNTDPDEYISDVIMQCSEHLLRKILIKNSGHISLQLGIKHTLWVHIETSQGEEALLMSTYSICCDAEIRKKNIT